MRFLTVGQKWATRVNSEQWWTISKVRGKRSDGRNCNGNCECRYGVINEKQKGIRKPPLKSRNCVKSFFVTQLSSATLYLYLRPFLYLDAKLTRLHRFSICSKLPRCHVVSEFQIFFLERLIILYFILYFSFKRSADGKRFMISTCLLNSSIGILVAMRSNGAPTQQEDGGEEPKIFRVD